MWLNMTTAGVKSTHRLNIGDHGLAMPACPCLVSSFRIAGAACTDVFFMPAGAAHSAENRGNATDSELATYIVKNGKPLLTRTE